MALTAFLSRFPASQALAMAEELRRHAEATGLPPAVEALPPRPRRAYDRLIDALNRLPRPLAAIGMLALLAAAAVAPDWFAARMETLAQMPEGLWWLIGAVLSLHFGARFQAHAQAHERDLMAAAVAAAAATAIPPRPEADSPGAAAPGPDAAVALSTLDPAPNAALEDWRRGAAASPSRDA
ncbi:hypothetical protein ruthe_01112 [Rubellimicrobium thermophilum DSM 16684]|uniref:Holin of 3TMs, for gene-transfer release n=1 Tax=Rubellimicrobium thermophilum DSM 16684 TaxID=1123069 RepID=S9R2U3_9RHOB|nr:3TM-type holin [Rubellimicrobium thermophilum]EPX86298.1 hypothetical protein ruthe_01112 [Rubellimicrobium thermophilum DSM 16684]